MYILKTYACTIIIQNSFFSEIKKKKLITVPKKMLFKTK